MRKLAQALGFEAMSLYNYVSNKDDLLDGILDLVLAEAEPPAPTGDWASAIRASAISVHAALGRHPWASALLMSPGRVRPERLRHMDLLLGRLREAGFSAATTYTAYHVLDAHILGFSLWHAGHSYVGDDIEDLVAWFTQSVTAETYPYLQEHARQHVEDGPHREVSAFELGLDLILDGLRRMHGALPADGAS
jgi:AcrR family transcriptional regulator